MTTFDGWPAEALTVLAEIAADNRADKWPELRDRHAAAVRGPTLALAAELAAEFGPVRVLRPHVSRRFRPAAPPLRTDTGGVAVSANGGALAFLLSPSHLTVTAGRWRFDRVQLLRYRAAVAGDSPDGGVPGGSAVLAEAEGAAQTPRTLRSISEERGVVDVGAELTVVVERLVAEAMRPDPDGELRGTPRGWRSSHPRIALARRRGLQVVRRWEVGPWISTPEPLERIRTAWRAAGPLMEWLDTNVGAAEADRPSAARELSTAASPG